MLSPMVAAAGAMHLATIGLTVHLPQATYFVQADVRGLGLDDGEAFARALPHDAGVVGTRSRYVRLRACPQGSANRR